jgi:AcrR family transcriptional regulator
MVTYQSIAADIRRRIETGRLRPGERLPSTREITRQWGVAVATATKALQALQADGLVRAVVGVGTVVAEPRASDPAVAARPVAATRRRPSGESEPDLTRDRIVRAATAIADLEGISAVTMRRLATELDVAVMSLYRHVPGKDDLVLLMADRVLGEVVLPDPLPEGWRAQVEAVAWGQWDLMKKHPWISSVMSLTRPLLVPRGMALMDRNMQVLRSLGFDVPTALHVAVVLSGLLLGVGVSMQMEQHAQRDTGLTSEEWSELQGDAFDEIVVQSPFPALAELIDVPDFNLELDDVYAIGLGLILDGLAQRLPNPPGLAG